MAKFPKSRLANNHRWRKYWKHPYSFRARHSRKFKKFCWSRGYVSPNFTRAEWACSDGTPVPYRLRKNAQRQAFNLELVRHKLGDRPIGGISYYRTSSYNRQIGGATASRHVYADATDFSVETVTRFGRNKFLAVAEKVYGRGGVGSYPSGSVHLDSRGYRARWNSW